jgi:hypothetical protein
LDTLFWRSKRKYLGGGTNSRWKTIARQRIKAGLLPSACKPIWIRLAGKAGRQYQSGQQAGF